MKLSTCIYDSVETREDKFLSLGMVQQKRIDSNMKQENLFKKVRPWLKGCWPKDKFTTVGTL